MSSTDHDPSSRSSSSLSVCSHLSAYRSNAAAGISKPFPLLLRCLHPRSSPLGRAEIVREPHELPRCSACAASDHPQTISSSYSLRLFACLACASVLCPTHAPLHHLPSSGHDIAVDVDRAELFCCPCNDQIYDTDFDAAVILSFNLNATSPTISRTKKRRVDYYRAPSAPSSSTTNSSGVDEEAMPARGLRGMNNLGNTCFMSSVLQALLHTPPLRNYFLSDRHNRFACQKGRRKKSGGGNANVRKLCLACDLDEMYSEVFSGDRIPYSPAKFLYRY